MILINKKTKTNQRKIGEKAEKKALKFLIKKGLTLIENNYFSSFGEIDLIMQENKTIIFVEVRYRKINSQVSAIESINTQKINKIRKTAKAYISRYKELPECRFDVIAMTNKNNSNYEIKWIKNAF